MKDQYQINQNNNSIVQQCYKQVLTQLFQIKFKNGKQLKQFLQDQSSELTSTTPIDRVKKQQRQVPHNMLVQVRQICEELELKLRKEIKQLKYDLNKAHALLAQSMKNQVDRKISVQDIQVRKFIQEKLTVKDQTKQQQFFEKKDESVVNLASKMVSNFQIDKEKGEIQLKNTNPVSCQLISRFLAREKPTSLTILKSPKMSIGFGVVSNKYFDDQNSIYKSRLECVCFRLSTGTIYDGGRQVNKIAQTIKQNQTIRMSLLSNTIYWQLDGKIMVKYQSKLFNNNNITWVPFIVLSHQNDRVRWKTS